MTKTPSKFKNEKHTNAEKGATPMSTLAATFTMNLIELGAPGFSHWLTTSFLKPKPKHKPGWFHYDEEMLFHEAFRSIVKELPREAVRIAEEGVKSTLPALGKCRAGYVGLLEILGLAEILAPESSPLALAKYLFSEVSPTRPIKNRIETQYDLIALRELLETQYRQFCLAAARGNASSYKELSQWSYEFLLNYQHRSDFAPAYAPMYVLALYTIAQGDVGPNADRRAARKYVERILKNSIATQSTTFSDLYKFESSRYPVGRFPYNLEPLLRIGEEIYRALENAESEDPKGAHDIPLILTHSPFDAPLSAATDGTLPRVIEKAAQEVDELHAELEMA